MQDISLIDFSNIFNTNDITNITNDLQNQILSSLGAINIILSYFSGDGTKIIYNNGTSDYLKDLSIQNNVISITKINPNSNIYMILVSNGDASSMIFTKLTDNYINDGTISQSKIINLSSNLTTINNNITNLQNNQPLSKFITALQNNNNLASYYLDNQGNWTQIVFSYLFSNFITDKLLLSQITTGTNNYVMAMNNSGTLNYQLLSDNNISSLSYSKINNFPSTTSNVLLGNGTYAQITDTQISTIAGAKITNATISYSKLLTYNNPSDLQFLKYNLTQDKLEYVTLAGSFFSDNTISYNKLGTKTNNYAFITTDSTHTNIVETVIDTSTKFNNYFANTIINLNKLNCSNYDVSKSQIPTQQLGSYIWYDMNSFIYTNGGSINTSNNFTLTQNSYSSHTFNYNNTYSSTDNSVFFNSSIYNSSYGTKQSTIQIRNYGGYMQYLLALDGYGMLYCSSQSNYISNGSSSSRGVNCPNWIYGRNICSGQSSFYGSDCITKSHADANYANINHYHVYNVNFVQRYDGYYFRTYLGSYSDHTYFMSSNSTSAPGIGTSYTWASLICGGGSSNYILEGRYSASQSSTQCYINSSGYFYTGSSKKIKDNIIKFDDIDDDINNDNDFNILDIIKNIKISIFKYNKLNDESHENFTKKLIIEDARETGIIVEDIEDYIKNNKNENKNKSIDILQSFITYDHRECNKNNDMSKCDTNDGLYCHKSICYNSIYNLNVHATKKLIKKVEKQNDIIIDLQTRLTNLEKLMETLTNKA